MNKYPYISYEHKYNLIAGLTVLSDIQSVRVFYTLEKIYSQSGLFPVKEIDIYMVAYKHMYIVELMK